MDENGTGAVLSVSTCDSCKVRGTGAMHHHRGTPVLFQCGVCDPASYWYAFKDAMRRIFLQG